MIEYSLSNAIFAIYLSTISHKTIMSYQTANIIVRLLKQFPFFRLPIVFMIMAKKKKLEYF